MPARGIYTIQKHNIEDCYHIIIRAQWPSPLRQILHFSQITYWFWREHDGESFQHTKESDQRC